MPSTINATTPFPTARVLFIPERKTNRLPGLPALCVGMLLIAYAFYEFYEAFRALDGLGAPRAFLESSALGVGIGVGMILAGGGLLAGLSIVKPNEAVVSTLFGRYVGTLQEAGLWWLNPFYDNAKIALALSVIQDDPIKVNDYNGNPIEIGAIITWRVGEPANAAFAVADVEEYVGMQCEAVMREIAQKHPYESFETNREGATVPVADGITTLRGHGDEIAKLLRSRLQEICVIAGVTIDDVRISHLSYAPEIAQTMLRRQMAKATLAAHGDILDNAVGIVLKAIKKIEVDGKDAGIDVELDAVHKAAMVSNLLVVMVGGNEARPVLNAGTLHVG